MDRNSPNVASKQFMKKYSIGTLVSRGYDIRPEKGEVWGPRGERVDKIQFFKGITYSQGEPRYRQVQFSNNGTNVKISAHILIWAFHNKRWPKDGYVINHIDGNTENNRIGNLEEITQPENIQHGIQRRQKEQ